MITVKIADCRNEAQYVECDYAKCYYAEYRGTYLGARMESTEVPTRCVGSWPFSLKPN